MKHTIRLFTLIALMLGVALVTTAAPNHSSSVKVPMATDMNEIAQLAQSKNLPIILVISADHCPYCEILENEIIKPMIFSGDYTHRALIYKLNIDDSQDIRDFNGEEISTGDFASNHNAHLTPTMMFLDAKGNELHQRILGINTVEMFGGRVDRAIAKSLSKLRNRTIANKQLQISLK